MSGQPTPAGVAAPEPGRRPLIAALIAFLLAGAVAVAVVWQSEQFRLHQQRTHLADLAGKHADAIQNSTQRDLSATYALAALVRQGKGNIANFDAIASELLPYYPGAGSLQLAPGGIVQHIVPLAGNEGAIGHNLLADPTRNKEAFLARDTGKLTLAGPFTLKQGGLGAVGRLPVFLDDSQGKPQFWGFTVVLIRYPQALEAARLEQLTQQGFGYELWRIHPDSGQKQSIAASAGAALINPVAMTLSMPNGSWTLSVAPLKGWHEPLGLTLKSALGLLFSLLLGYLVKLLFEFRAHERHLEALVLDRTAEISTRKRAQDEILRLNASLEERVQQRTEDLEEKNKKNKQLQALSEELQSQQEELRQSNEELEEKNQLLADQKLEVEHKNREIEAAKLMLEDKAEQLALTSKYKSEFLSSMSHELRTPLNSLLILAQMLAENVEHNLSEQQIEYAKTIQGAGKDLLALINDILDLSKIESGTVTLGLDDVSFANVGEQLERSFRHVAEKHGLGFSVELTPNLPPSLYTDAQRLQQVMKNLLSNAFKFTNKGRVSVRIAAVKSGWSVAHDGLNRAQAVIGFFVTDSGIGLAAEKQKIIFEAFQQADTGTAKKYGGTGLGLSISRELAWLLGGELHLAMSEPGKGSTFALYLPLRAPESGQGGTSLFATETQRHRENPESKKPLDSFTPDATQSTPAQEGAADANPQPPAVADDRASINPGDRTLLIIEDDARFADILLRAARDKGFKGIVAMRGDDGLKLADEFRPTAITLDLHLPDMDGWVVLERLKRNPDTRHIPVEIISVEDNRPRGLRYGAFEYLVKPVTAESLQKALADVNKFAERELKDLLVAVGDEQHRNNVLDLIGSGDVRIKAVTSGKDALAALKKKRYDCIVLDLNLPDISVADLLEAIQGLDLTRDVPVIVYGMDKLPQQEQERLKSLALKGIVKEVRTPERLLDETALFLHRVVSKLPEERRQMLDKLYLSADSLAGKKVLVVDDDVRNIFALTAILERHKMAVLSAENGLIALEELGQNPDVDIVLMDIMMPEMDGYEAMRRIRQMKQFESLPMIALTAKAMKGDREKCIAAGASDYLSKPVDTDQLVSLLRVWLYQ